MASTLTNQQSITSITEKTKRKLEKQFTIFCGLIPTSNDYYSLHFIAKIMKLFKVLHSKLNSTAVRVDYVNAEDFNAAAAKINTLYNHERVVRRVAEIN